MTLEVGAFGAWVRKPDVTPEMARDIEGLGYGALWVGSSPDGDLALIEQLLTATSDLVLATGIINMWRDDAMAVAESYRRVEAGHPGRFLLGVGIGHPEATAEYRSPYDTTVAYLDELEANGVPPDRTVLAALGPRVLALAATRTAGAHPYLTTPRHTRFARDAMGPGPLLAPEQKVVVGGDRLEARTTGRRNAARYLRLANYRNNLLREGWTEADLDGGGSDRLVDELVLHGDPGEVAAGLRAHLDAGADHVCIQVLDADPVPALRRLAPVLLG